MMFAQIDMLPLRPIASDAMAVSTRSTRKVTLEVPAKADCSALANRSNSAWTRRISMFEKVRSTSSGGSAPSEPNIASTIVNTKSRSSMMMMRESHCSA